MGFDLGLVTSAFEWCKGSIGIKRWAQKKKQPQINTFVNWHGYEYIYIMPPYLSLDCIMKIMGFLRTGAPLWKYYSVGMWGFYYIYTVKPL